MLRLDNLKYDRGIHLYVNKSDLRSAVKKFYVRKVVPLSGKSLDSSPLQFFSAGSTCRFITESLSLEDV